MDWRWMINTRGGPWCGRPTRYEENQLCLLLPTNIKNVPVHAQPACVPQIPNAHSGTCHQAYLWTCQHGHLQPWGFGDPPLQFSCAETEQINATVDGGYICSVGTTFVTSQHCTAVSVGTCIAVARFLVGFGGATCWWVGVPPGFAKPLS